MDEVLHLDTSAVGWATRMTSAPNPETVERVIGILGLYTAPRRIEAGAALIEDLVLDWVHLQSIACELDEAFGVEINDAAVREWRTIEDIARSVDQRIGVHP